MTVKVGPILVPPGVERITRPVIAPVGTTTTAVVSVLDKIVALTPPNLTKVAPAKFVPVIVIWSATRPELVESEVIFGATRVGVVTLWQEEIEIFVPLVALSGQVAPEPDVIEYARKVTAVGTLEVA